MAKRDAFWLNWDDLKELNMIKLDEVLCPVTGLCTLGGDSGSSWVAPWLGIVAGTWQRPGMQHLRLLAAPTA